MTPRLATAAFGALMLLGGCATTPSIGDVSSSRLSLERDFAGRFYAAGAFTSAITGAKRPFTTVFDGERRAGGFTLSERIAFADGERQHVTWRFEKLSAGHYRGRREDVVGAAEVVADGHTLRLSYDVILTDAGKTQVHFEDIIARDANGRIVNRAVVSKFGVPFGTVDIAFSRRPPR